MLWECETCGAAAAKTTICPSWTIDEWGVSNCWRPVGTIAVINEEEEVLIEGRPDKGLRYK